MGQPEVEGRVRKAVTLKRAQTIVFWLLFWLYILYLLPYYMPVFSKVLIKPVTHKLEMAELEITVIQKFIFQKKHVKQVKKVPKKN